MTRERARERELDFWGTSGTRVLMVAILIAIGGLAVGGVSRNASAAVPVTFYGSNGYAGNTAVYMTSGVTTPYVIATSSSSADQPSNVNPYGVHNSISLMVGQDSSTPLSGPVLYEQYAPTGGLVDGGPVLNIWIPVAAAGAGGSGGSWIVLRQQLAATLSNSPIADSTVNFLTSTNSGINVTGPNWSGQTPLNAYLARLGIDALGFLPGYGWVFGVYSTANDALSGIEKGSNPGVNGQGTANEYFDVKGGYVCSGLVCKYKGNFFTSQSEVLIQIPASEFLTNPGIVIKAKNWINVPTCLIDCPYQPAATTSVSLSPTPAVMVTGRIAAGGVGLPNQAIEFTTVNPSWILTYVATTDSSGNFRWFAAPSTSYTLNATFPTSFGPISASTTFTTPSSATIQSVSLTLPAYTSISGQVKDSSSGSPIAGASVTATLGTSSAKVTTNSAGNYVVTVKATGTYSLTASASSHSSQTQSVTVSSLSTAYSAPFSLTYTPSGGCIAWGTPILTPNGYVPIQDLKPGDAVMGYDFATGKLVPVTLLSAKKSWQDSLVSINGGQLLLTAQDQPIYAEHAGTIGWVRNPEDLQVGDRLFDPVSGHWVRVWSIEPVYERIAVYDVITGGANNFVANGLLLDQKCMTC